LVVQIAISPRSAVRTVEDVTTFVRPPFPEHRDHPFAQRHVPGFSAFGFTGKHCQIAESRALGWFRFILEPF
jgi:hypothetical protein